MKVQFIVRSFYFKYPPSKNLSSTKVALLLWNCATIVPRAATGKGLRKPLSRRGFFPCLFPSLFFLPIAVPQWSVLSRNGTNKKANLSSSTQASNSCLGVFSLHKKDFGGLGEQICPLVVWPIQNRGLSGYQAVCTVSNRSHITLKEASSLGGHFLFACAISIYATSNELVFTNEKYHGFPKSLNVNWTQENNFKLFMYFVFGIWLYQVYPVRPQVSP